MSLQAPKSCGESVFQYCNYGYDKTKYSSYQDCMLRHPAVACPDGDTTGKNNAPKKNDGVTLKHKITNIFFENDGFSLRVKPIPTGVLIVGLYIAYKKFKK